MGESTFKFRISLGYAGIIDLWIEIPMELYNKVRDSVGSSKMERLEFGFFEKYKPKTTLVLDTIKFRKRFGAATVFLM